MVNARRSIPWQSPIPFHVAIEREHFAVRTEIEIVRVSEPGQDQFPFLAFGIGPHHVTSRRENADCVPIGIPLPSQEKILLRSEERRVGKECRALRSAIL